MHLYKTTLNPANMNRVGDVGGVDVSFDVTPTDEIMTWHIMAVITEAARGEAVECRQVTVIVTDDKRLHSLNREYLGLDEPTDVLSFNLNEADESNIEGEIYISLDKVNEQASENGDSPMKVLMRLTVHGFLHLCGYDHQDAESLQKMLGIGESYIGSIVEKE